MIISQDVERSGPRILIIDDDQAFCEVLSGALERRGYRVGCAHDVERALASARLQAPDDAVLDLRMPGPSGLTAIKALLSLNPRMRIVVLTGFASISTAVEAIKLGAVHYLTKPANADEIIGALHRTEGDQSANPPETRMPLERMEWEHIQKTLAACGGNVSVAAKQLGLHRRTLQRKLHKRPSGLA